MLPRPFSDKRSSTGNLCYFTDQFDNHPWENPELNQTLRNTVSLKTVSNWAPSLHCIGCLLKTKKWNVSSDFFEMFKLCREKRFNIGVQARRRKSSEKKSGGGDAEGGDVDEEGPDPATTLQAMAGVCW